MSIFCSGTTTGWGRGSSRMSSVLFHMSALKRHTVSTWCQFLKVLCHGICYQQVNENEHVEHVLSKIVSALARGHLSPPNLSNALISLIMRVEDVGWDDIKLNNDVYQWDSIKILGMCICLHHILSMLGEGRLNGCFHVVVFILCMYPLMTTTYSILSHLITTLTSSIRKGGGISNSSRTKRRLSMTKLGSNSYLCYKYPIMEEKHIIW